MSEGWIETALGDVAEIRLGKMLSRDSREHPVRSPYLRNANVQWDDLQLDDLREMHFSGTEKVEFALRAGDVLVCEGGEVGRCAVLDRDLRGIFFQKALHRVRCGPRLNPRFLAHTLRHAALHDGFADLATQSTIQHLTKEKLAQLTIALPPLDEQRRIVDLLSRVEEARDRALAVLEANKRALQSVRERVAAEAPVAPLVELASDRGIQIGPFGSQLHAYEYATVGVPVVMPQDLVSREIDETRIARVPPEKAQALARHRLNAGDILMPRRGDLTKRAIVGQTQEGWLCGTGTVRVRLRAELDSRVVFELLSTRATDEWLATNAVGTTMPNLNTEIVGNIPVPVVTGASAREFRDATTAMNCAIRRLREVSGRIDGVRAALMVDLLTRAHEIPERYDALLVKAAA